MEGRQFFLDILNGFTEWLTRLNYAEESIKSRSRQLKSFLEWIADRGIETLSEISQKDLEDYNKHLHQRALGSRTIEGYISVLKLVNDYLENYGQAPIIRVKLKIEKDIKTERTILSKAEISGLYDACGGTPWGLRDRAMIAIYYGCGLRCSEGTRLELKDVDFGHGLIHVRKGKNYRERYVPMSSGVAKELRSWIEETQVWFAGRETNYVLPNRFGRESRSSGLNRRLKMLCEKARIGKHITLHCLRHSIATHLSQSGMELEKISQFLGHQSLEATQVYTRILSEKDG
jgi:site-specific recombinase XerD